MSMNGRRRVVVTGIGAVSPLGNDAETSWQNLISGESGADTIQQFDASESGQLLMSIRPRRIWLAHQADPRDLP